MQQLLQVTEYQQHCPFSPGQDQKTSEISPLNKNLTVQIGLQLKIKNETNKEKKVPRATRHRRMVHVPIVQKLLDYTSYCFPS